MVLFDMQIQQMTSGEVLTALRAAIHMSLQIMNFVVLVGCKRERLAVRR
jgi:hypothetical protein